MECENRSDTGNSKATGILDTAHILESVNLRVKNTLHVLNNIIYRINWTYTTAAKLYAIQVPCINLIML